MEMIRVFVLSFSSWRIASKRNPTSWNFLVTPPSKEDCPLALHHDKPQVLKQRGSSLPLPCSWLFQVCFPWIQKIERSSTHIHIKKVGQVCHTLKENKEIICINTKP